MSNNLTSSTSMSMASKELIEQATFRQNNAADGTQSVWVSASAGTGKTFVLTKRILGLLLKDESLKPSEILAVTFTRAAAREMEERLRSQLAFWATCTEQELIEALEKIIGHVPSQKHLIRAKMLFAEFLDHPVESNTIHGFCQKILAQFPLEADISPSFKLIEGQDQLELLRRAKSNVFAKALEGELKPSWVFDCYASAYGEKSLSEALDAFVANAGRFKRYFKRYDGLEGVQKHLASRLKVDDALTFYDLNHYEAKLSVLSSHQLTLLNKASEALLQGGKVAGNLGEQLKNFVFAEDKKWANLKDVFLTGKGEIRKQGFPDKKALEFGGEDLWLEVEEFSNFILIVEEKMKAIKSYVLTLSYLHLGDLILKTYENVKRNKGVLDFDDLISKTANLLQSVEKNSWVRFKMDQKMRHVLLDEAQDTDSDQWHILKAIVDEFYAGKGVFDSGARTFFAVGDMKQSIYRFRGAEPHVFSDMKKYLNQHKEKSGHAVAVEELMVSFRSTEPVLKFVDMVFKDTERHQAVDDMADKIEHNAVQTGSSGVVSISPLLEKNIDADSAEYQPWSLPSRIKKVNLKEQIAEQTVQQIIELLNSRDVLECTKQYIQTGDIMILLRSRALMAPLIAALDKHHIPHGGADQVSLQSETVVQDLLALLKFMISNDDDLSLAHILRSPLFGLNDDEFDNIFIYKKSGKNVWESLQKSSGAGATLYDLCRTFQKQNLLSFLSEVIQKLNVRGVYYALMGAETEKSVVTAVDDALDTLLNMAMDMTKKGHGIVQLIHKLDTQNLNLKREPDAGNRVRLMTTHGSKGLESPIVIMPDTTGDFYKNMASDKTLWQTTPDGEDTLFIHRKPSAEAPVLQGDLIEIEKERVFRDEMRLLYVALTRAKERVYISGVKKHGYNPENCWYGHIISAIQNTEKFQKNKNDTFIYKVSNQLTSEADSVPMGTLEDVLPIWAQSLAPREMGLTLMHASDALKRKEQIKLLTQKEKQKQFKRGQVVHRLLEFLPLVEPTERKEKGLQFLKQVAFEYDMPEQLSLLGSAMNVMEKYAEYFNENSKAEVPLAATIGQKRLEGVVDRLIVSKNQVIAIDYKTNGEVPTDIPKDYIQQMHFYKKALIEIFPNKDVKTALIWTSLAIPRLDWV